MTTHELKTDTGPFALVPRWVLELATPTELVVYAWLADHADRENGVCWPGQDRLARLAGVSDRTVRTALQGLAEKGCVSQTRRGLGLTNVYIVRRAFPDDLPPLQSGPEADFRSDRKQTSVAVRKPPSDKPEPVEPEPENHIALSRKTTAPTGLTVTDAMSEWARTKGLSVDLERETEQFLDHHRAKGSKFKDWTAAWRTWMRNAQKWAPAEVASRRFNPLDDE